MNDSNVNANVEAVTIVVNGFVTPGSKDSFASKKSANSIRDGINWNLKPGELVVIGSGIELEEAVKAIGGVSSNCSCLSSEGE